MRKRFIGVLAGAVLVASLIVGCAGGGRVQQNMQAGTYTATVAGYGGPLSVEVTVNTNAITNVRVTSHLETPGFGEWPIELIPARIIESQSLAVDVVTGVTVTSRAILLGVEETLRQAGANIEGFTRPARTPRARNQNLRADVIIVGGGGAGLAAAVSALESGASVILIEKAGFVGGNTVAARGNMNAAASRQQSILPGTPGLDALVIAAFEEAPVNAEHQAMQNRLRAEFEQHRSTSTMVFDSAVFHALQTWTGGDRIAPLPLIYIMTSGAASAVQWLETLGLQFQPTVGQGGGALYPRTLLTVMPNGTGYITAFSQALAGNDRYTQLLETRATGLIVERGRVVGVNAEGRQGNRITLRANRGVILATGGFSANVELRQRYAEGEMWPYLGPTLIHTNVSTVTGDGIFFARDAGAHLLNMEHIQLMQEAHPVTGNINDSATPFGVMGYMFINREGRRFVAEDGRRDVVVTAINQEGGVVYMLQSSESVGDPNVASTFDGRTVAFMLENDLSGFVMTDTLEEMAAALGLPPANLVETVASFNAAVDAGSATCEFGRALVRRIATGPWLAYARAPAIHHTMGGVLVDEYTRVLMEDGSVIPGLFAAGEITGVLHGANRLGGNAFTDIIVFGRVAGQSAALGR